MKTTLLKGIAICTLFCSTAFSQEEHLLITTPQLKISYVVGNYDVEYGNKLINLLF